MARCRRRWRAALRDQPTRPWSGSPTASITTSNARAFAERLRQLAGAGVLPWSRRARVRRRSAPAPPSPPAARLEAQVLRAGGGTRVGMLHAHVGARPAARRGALQARRRRDARVATFDLPLELRNQVTRIEIAGERSAGAVHLLDARSQWHRVGLISGESREQAQPLLAPLYYIERALAPFAEIAKTDGRQPGRRHRRPHQAQRLGAHAGRHRHAAGRGQGAGRASG